MLLLGDYSTGKSGCAAIMLKAAAAHGFIGLWVRARELPKFVVEKTSFDEDATVIQRAERVPILVIDEVQIRAKLAYAEEAVEMLVRQRIDDQLCTILTTNHPIEELKKKYRALTEALTEAVEPVIVSGYNFRLDKAKELTTNV